MNVRFARCRGTIIGQYQQSIAGLGPPFARPAGSLASSATANMVTEQKDVFDSSDSVRSGQPLKYVQTVTFGEPLDLEHGGRLPRVTVAYETYGELNAARSNAVLVCHALSGDSHVASHGDDDSPGWWELLVGPGKVIDTNRYFVISPNVLGGCRGTTGPNSIQPDTGRPYGADFPLITVGDMVAVQRRLVDHLGIDGLLAVVGGSLGGHMVLEWATRYPERTLGVAALATSPRLTSQALAFDVVGRNAILSDPAFMGGQYYQGPGPAVGLALARMLGHITYLSREAMTRKFDSQRMQPREIRTQFETKFAVGSYLAYQGDKFVERFDPNSYLTLTMAMDLFNLGETHDQLAERMGRSSCRWIVLSFSSDWLFPPFQSQEIVNALIAGNKPVSYCNVRSNCGHDAFLLADELPVYGEMVRAFLDHLYAEATYNDKCLDQGRASGGRAADSPVSIFHGRRVDYDQLLELIPQGVSVLDLGCGTGGLMARLKARGPVRAMGVEQDEQALLTCIRRGLDVVQADLNEGLPAFADGQFDYVVLSQTLQTVVDVPRVLSEMLRVGRRGIVSFPNVAHQRLREELFLQGRAPRVGVLEEFDWYNTPNVRFLSISDFLAFCEKHSIRIHEQIALDTETGHHVSDDPNRNADLAIMVISR